jgi:hypothetical protein
MRNIYRSKLSKRDAPGGLFFLFFVLTREENTRGEHIPSKGNKSLMRYAPDSAAFASACSSSCLQGSRRERYNRRWKHIPSKILLLEEKGKQNEVQI